ncbi:PREDICTED: uncharacterized protein LOC18586292 isoform X1 [Theobroma cacao]|uniref:Uncharacterized protein LOC18586292 isoform X1 n=1 Tax=Theobroma cacao TaxID=3641 RepID=A0AB32X1H9_THECC|nr:PREDICTED: uncharacterized protein LOC18586292 isoform X1 [Theobroma cacao]
MSVSGNEETGVKPSVGQFSEYSAGIPIKKRRFPLIWTSSQQTEDSPSLPTENDSEQKGFSSPLQGSAISNASTVTASSNTGSVLASSNTCGVLASSNISVVGVSSNTSGVAARSNTSGVAGSSDASGVATSLNVNAGSIAASSNAVSVAASSNAVSVAASSNTSCVAASSNAVSVAVSSNASCVAANSHASSVSAGSNASSTVETSKPNSVAASLSNASSIAASVSSFSDASEKTVPEKEKRSYDGTNGSMVQGNNNLLRVKLEEQSFPVNSRSLADIDSKGKLVATGESDNILRKSAKSELDLVGGDSLTLNIGKDVYSQQNVDGQFRSELPTVSGNPGLSLALGEHLVSAIAGGNNERDCLKQEKAEPVSLNLSLSKGECSTQLRSNNVQPNSIGANMLADRSNWDLNTTMDAWEGPASNDGASQKTTHMDAIKPVLCSGGMPGTSMPTQQQRVIKIAMSSALSSQQYNTEDSLRLGLTTPYLHLNSNEKPSSTSAKEDLREVTANINLPAESVPVSNLTVSNFKPVKSEPLDESIKTNSAAVKADPKGLLNIVPMKHELVDRSSSESSKSSTLKLADARSVKPEPVHEDNQETSKRMEGSLNQSDEQILHPLNNTTVPTSTDLSLHGDASNHVEHFIQAKETESSGEGQVASKMISSVGHDDNESNISGKIDNSTSENKSVEDPDNCRLKFMAVQPSESRGTVEGSVSDEEKINLSGDILEDSYGSGYESDGNRDLAPAMDMEHDGRAEDDFEDGEVRETVENTEIEAPVCEGQEAGNGNNGDTGYKNSDSVWFVGDNKPSSSSVSGKETCGEDAGKTSNDSTNECIDTSVNKDSNTEADKEACLQESSAVEMPSSPTDKKIPNKAMPRKPLDLSEKKDAVEGQDREQTSIQASDSSQGTSVTIGQGADNAQKTESEGKSNSVLPKVEAFLSGDDAGKDVSSAGNRSRIINLSRALNQSSPGRTRSISGRTMQSRGGRERLLDVALEGDKFHPRGRDEVYGDGSHRFSRERHHDQPSRNPRISFMRGRGRVSSWIDTLRGGRDSERNFASEFYNGPTEFRVVRHKYASAVSDADLDFSSYNNGQDGAYFGPGQGGRKILSDNSSIFAHVHPRRRSPGGRDGPASRGLPMVRRVPRNLSPSRCIGEDGSESVGLRHMRGFADDHTDPMFTRSQPSFEGLDGPFVRGNRDFSSVQRRGLPRIRSKSPTRPRTRSPGPWPSPRRRSPDEFGGPLELPHRRSPIYRLDRIRSPDRPCFAGEMVLRRHGSPPYLSRPSNDLRDMDPGRDHGHPRSGIPNRSPSGRILLRNSRRLDLVDPRERSDGDDYFGGPMPSGRFHELATDGNADERRRYGDRRGPVRPFRPPYSGADSENFHLNAEGGPRSFRFCPEDDPELHERGTLREREFDRRLKNRPGNAPRRTRNIEEEGNFRHGGQVWHDDGFDDMSRVKRKRF